MTHQPTHQILIIEDEPAIRSVLSVLLRYQGYKVIEAGTAAGGEIAARNHEADLLLVDLGLPDGDGVDVIRHVRSWSSVPIIVLSARVLGEDRILAMDAGADDYITKPFFAPDLLARIRAGLRRSAWTERTPLLQFGTIRVDLRSRTSQRPGGDIYLTPVEYRVLDCLSRQGGMIVRQSQLFREVSCDEGTDDARTLRVYINSLRNKLEPDPSRPRYLLTEIGLGYRLRTTEDLQLRVAPEGN